MENLPLQLVTGCTKQDPGRQKLLFEEYYTMLMKVAFRYVSTYEQAFDETLNGYLRIFRECIRFRAHQKVGRKETLSAWIKRVFIITLIDRIKAEPESHFPRPIPGDLWLPYDKLPTDMEKMHIELIKVLKELPVSSRLVFNLHVIDGFSHREIAGMLDIAVEDSKRNLIKARRLLQQALAGRERYKK
jgi:RNA polymerase sigma factor (sigma-70 family)